MKVQFWGVRGSFPVASPHAIRYGGNTPCVEVAVETGGRTLVVDAGTGIRGLGRSLLSRDVLELDLLLSHAHWDHIQGFPHFEPLYREDVHVTVHALKHPRHALADIIRGQQEEPFYPVPLDQLRARIDFVEHADGETFDLGGARLCCRRLNHPGVAGGYRIEADGQIFAYVSDTDLNGRFLLASDLPVEGDDDHARWLQRLRAGARDLSHGADVLIGDTFFLPDEYDPNWGHSRPEDFIELATDAQVHTLCLFHHRPGRSDDELDTIVTAYRNQVNGSLQIIGAREGLELSLAS